jgi:hypothetical protein
MSLAVLDADKARPLRGLPAQVGEGADRDGCPPQEA